MRPASSLVEITGTKDPSVPESLYAEAFAAPDTIDTLPEKTLLALSRMEAVPQVMDPAGGHSARVIDEFETEDVDVGALATRLQEEGAAAFVKSWHHLMGNIADKGATLAKVVNR